METRAVALLKNFRIHAYALIDYGYEAPEGKDGVPHALISLNKRAFWREGLDDLPVHASGPAARLVRKLDAALKENQDRRYPSFSIFPLQGKIWDRINAKIDQSVNSTLGL